MNRPIPERGPALRGLGMIVEFDVDCGELLPGHRFIARGLSGPAAIPTEWPDQEWDDGELGGGDSDGALTVIRNEDRHLHPNVTQLAVPVYPVYPGFSLEYELVPGVREDEFPRFFDCIVGIEYSADFELPWEPSDSGAIAPAAGGASTHGSRGDWPLPPYARVLTFALSPPWSARPPDAGPAGELVVDLAARTATWRPR